MGTNYYLEMNEACPTCGNKEDDLHIGKSSQGWCFSLHVYPDKGIEDLPDWGAYFENPECSIVDEYGVKLTTTEMIWRIVNRTWVRESYRDKEFLNQNYAEIGPNNLLRHKTGDHCIGHGAGTWDLIIGEFS